MNEVKTALVIGGGPAGLEAAIKISQAGHKVILVERTDSLGGILLKLYSSFPRWENPGDLVNYLTEQISNNSFITTMTETTVTAVKKRAQGYQVTRNGSWSSNNSYWF